MGLVAGNVPGDGQQRQAGQRSRGQCGRATGLIQQAAHRVAIVMRGEQARKPADFFIAGMLVADVVLTVVLLKGRLVMRPVHYPVHQTLGIGQQQGTGQSQHPA